MSEVGTVVPKGFKFFVGLCLFIGAIGLMGDTIFLFLGLSHGLSPKVEQSAPVFWLSALHLVRDTGYLYGGIKVRKHVTNARVVILLCAASSLFELFYNTAMSLSAGELRPSPMTMSYFLLPLLVEGSILVFFSRKAVRDFVANPSE